MKYSKYLLFLAFLVSNIAFSKVDKNSENKKKAVEIINHYSKAKFITADIKKIDEKSVLGTKTVSQGLIKYSSGKFYLLLQSEKKTEIFFKRRNLILVDYPDLDFDKEGVRKITHIKDQAPAFLKSLIDLFSNSKNFFDQFKIIDTSLKEDILTLDLKPKLKGLKDLNLELNIRDKTIQTIHFIDDIKTATTIEFSHVDLKTIIPKATFEFKSQKSDQEATQ